ncbi:VTT domain-containing protein [Desulfogranum japonicum]|uniref:VTT domain-containing protein n=1 Tax=Desulfogranum japonicum TaxID=231447 RepID=UPI0004092F55|nr:VTT domain-containing protein [Desulfogranum japonicum]
MTVSFTPGKNCWKTVQADQVSIIVDGADYYQAIHESMQMAQESILITGWDLHSEVQLIRGDTPSELPTKLGKFLNTLARKNKHLKIFLLSWDFAMIYAMEREFFPRYKLKWRTHRRIQFCLDGEHPIGASQHQKVVVIDDKVAFCGGLDISKWRWDTSEHLPENPLRVAPEGDAYPPFHDIQMVVSGAAAQALGELVRQRWQRATGNVLPSPSHAHPNIPWPESIPPLFANHRVVIARTFPKYKDYPEIREVEQLYLDSIAAAKHYIYIENQYLSSYIIGEALKKRLLEKNGPQIIAVMPQKTGGWLEQHTMDILRGRILRKLKEADRHDRLRVYYPRVGINPEVSLMVHAKVMIIDDTFIHIGSSNLSNRSLGLDSECDLALAAESETEQSETIATFRNRLLAEHLGKKQEEVTLAMHKHATPIAAIEALRDEERTLIPVDENENKEIDQWVPESKLLDPEKPLEPDEFFNYLIKPRDQVFAYRHLLKIVSGLVILLGITALWRWTPLNQFLTVESVLEAGKWVQQQPLAPLMVPLAFIVGGLAVFPITLMIIATVVLFGPWLGPLYAILGAELSALILFILGRHLGRSTVQRMAGSILNRVNKRLSENGIAAVITFRIIPVAPFSVVNLVAGASNISRRDFILGTFIGLLPGIITITLVADQIARSLKTPDFGSIGTLMAVFVGSGLGLYGLRKWLKNKKQQRNTGS